VGVRISGFRQGPHKAHGVLTVEARVTGTVSLEPSSRASHEPDRAFVLRSQGRVFTLEWLGRILTAYLRRIKSKEARLKVAFSYPIRSAACAAG